jgi:hypothetical protein
MTLLRATLCLVVALAGCAPAPVGLSAEALCAQASSMVGAEVTVTGPFATDVVSPLGGSVVRCTPGTCCNVTYYAPTIACADGTRIHVGVDVDLLPVTDISSLSWVCSTGSDDLRPSAECPIGEGCIAELGRVASVRGTLVESDGRYFVAATSATTLLPPEGEGP